ncbi:helix-turn-helix domain-containing protein [Sphingomonas sp. Leaf25]|uniref:helix-turn-helix domain-containing protein n=1 Tax=Sphingomonas sp. Leaf25 TaxID=1735692 RepID=UPI0006F36B4E|nr:transcriptional regulator [Sphingomonas sp. Leaf25]KQM98297.1 hypothetical protein ASE78_08640 [Sphingomonas sp. Leaf25]
MKSAFDKIAAGLNDAIAHATGEADRAKEASPIDVAAIRRRTGMTQAQFAQAYHLPVGTVRDWEQSRTRPDAPARVLLTLIGTEPETIERIVRRA